MAFNSWYLDLSEPEFGSGSGEFLGGLSSS